MWAETTVPITPEDSHGPVAGVLDSSSQTEYTAEGGAREMPLERALRVVIPPSLPRAKAGLLPPALKIHEGGAASGPHVELEK